MSHTTQLTSEPVELSTALSMGYINDLNLDEFESAFIQMHEASQQTEIKLNEQFEFFKKCWALIQEMNSESRIL